MNIPIVYYNTVSADRTKPYFIVRVSGMQMIDTAWRDEVAMALTQLLATRIVLAGQMPSGGWQVYGEAPLVQEVQRAADAGILDVLPWQEATLTVPDTLPRPLSVE